MIRHPKEEEIPRLFEIWERCFGDSKEYISLFFAKRFDVQETWVADVEGVPEAVLYLLPCRIQSGGKSLEARYIYAAATHPDAQGKGLMTALLDHAADDCAGRGVDALILVPGSGELFRFYEKRGYRTAFYLHKALAPGGTGRGRSSERPQSLSAGAMLDIRRAALKDQCFVDWDERALEHVLEENRMQGGTIVTAQQGDRRGYALCVPGERQVFVSEWMAQKELFETLLSEVSETFPDKEVLLRTAYGLLPDTVQGEKVPFGMICPLSAEGTVEGDAYLGLPMD
ncbi:MAG: GNAT family N-acetyltransferase [Clostridiales bacterium]|nr:GNAT family N-acetyltransferase [Clostridiales bacterium]